MRTSAPCHSWRFLGERIQEGALCLSQRESPWQCERQPGFSLVPELDAESGVDAPESMDQIRNPVCRRTVCGSEPQGPRGAGRRDGCRGPNAPREAALDHRE